MDDSTQRADIDEFTDDASGQPLPARSARPTPPSAPPASSAPSAPAPPRAAAASPPVSSGGPPVSPDPCRRRGSLLGSPGRVIVAVALVAAVSTLLTARIVVPSHARPAGPVVHGPMDRWPGVIHLVEGDVLKIPVTGPTTPVAVEVGEIADGVVKLHPIDPDAVVEFVLER